MKFIKCSCAGVCDSSRQVHLATDAFLATLNSTPHSKAALKLLKPRGAHTHWHVYLTWVRTEAAKPDSLEWLITFLNMSACVARLCTVEAEAGPEEPQPKPFRAAILEWNTLEVVCSSILQAIEVTSCIIIQHCSCIIIQYCSCIQSLFCSQLMLMYIGRRRPGLAMIYMAAEALILLCMVHWVLES